MNTNPPISVREAILALQRVFAVNRQKGSTTVLVQGISMTNDDHKVILIVKDSDQSRYIINQMMSKEERAACVTVTLAEVYRDVAMRMERGPVVLDLAAMDDVLSMAYDRIKALEIETNRLNERLRDVAKASSDITASINSTLAHNIPS